MYYINYYVKRILVKGRPLWQCNHLQRSNGMTDKKQQTIFRNIDVRLLRERLVCVMKKSPTHIAEQINKTLLMFAKNTREYCKHEEFVFITAEGKDACLNCGFLIIL